MAKSTAPAVPATNVQALQPYQMVHESTGQIVDKFKYLEGHPRQYRFDAKEGVFNINGTDKIGRTITFQPLAWRIFVDSILGQGTKNWAELFFVDEKDCVSSILFHGYSVDNIFKLIEPLYYDDLTLADVVITVIAERKENTKIQPKGIYHIATFSYKMADPVRTAEFKQYARDRHLFRQETLTDLATMKVMHCYYNALANGETPEALPDGMTPEQLNGAVEQLYLEQDETANELTQV